MKKFGIMVLIVVMVFTFAACGGGKETSDSSPSAQAGGSESKEAGSIGESDSTPAEVARVENGRLSGIEPPEGWLLGEAMSENQLIYAFKHDLYDEFPQDAPEIGIDIDEWYDTPEECLASAIEQSEEWDEEYEVGEVTMGAINIGYWNSLYRARKSVGKWLL